MSRGTGKGNHVGSRMRLAVAAVAVVVAALVIPAAPASARAHLTLSLVEANVGQEVIAKGKGFKPRKRGRLKLNGEIVATFRTSRGGRFKVPFVVRDVADGAAKVTARAGSTRASSSLLIGTILAPVKPASSPRPSPSPSPSPSASPSPSPSASPSPSPTESPSTTTDPYIRRVRAELKVFTDWLATNGVQGNMGEIGWPNNIDTAQYNELARLYLSDMKAAGVKGAVWATGEWWGTGYGLSAYVRSSGAKSIDTARSPSAVMESFPEQAGVHVNGGEFGAVYGTTSTSSFSNENPGTYNTNWHYDNQASFDYLAARGIQEVVIPFRWERIQPKLGGPLDTAELTRLRDAISRAGAAGMKAVPMVANYAAYWLHDPATNKGVRRAIGTSHVTVAHFTDLWTRLSAAFRGNDAIASYGLMREPAGMPGATVRDQAKLWETASQAAVTAIRDSGDTSHLLVSGYRFSNTHTWPNQHPVKWITDPANDHSYEAHHYWASTYDASYQSYAKELELSRQKGY